MTPRYIRQVAGRSIAGSSAKRLRAAASLALLTASATAALGFVSLRPDTPLPNEVITAQTHCEFTAFDTVAYSSVGVNSLRIEAGPGSLRIEGTSTGAEQVRLIARRCASTQPLLDQLWFDLLRDEDEMSVRVQIPEHMFSRTEGSTAAIDLWVEVPSRLTLSVVDNLGDVEISHVSELMLEDALGDIRIEGIAGDLSVKAGPGAVFLRNIEGSVSLEVTVGTIEVRGVAGNVDIAAEHTGLSDIHDVDGTVTIGDNHDGDVRVVGVGRDLVIEGMLDGELRHSNVSGQVIRRGQGID